MRSALFKRRFPYAHATVYKMRKFYKEHKIKKKSIRFSKLPAPRHFANIQEDIMNLKQDIESAALGGFRIVQLDEMMVTKNTFPSHDWSKCKHNTLLD